MIKLSNPLVLISISIFLSACTPEIIDTGPPLTNDRGNVEALARQALTAIQPRSIRENKEYCGSIVARPSGQVYATKPVPGGPGWCQIPDIDGFSTYKNGDRLVADYHTHAGYDSDYDSEVPSTDDMESNGAEGVPGYVSTPGGRFWFIRSDGKIAYQLCGVGCLPDDPNFIPETGASAVPQRITIQGVANR